MKMKYEKPGMAVVEMAANKPLLLPASGGTTIEALAPFFDNLDANVLDVPAVPSFDFDDRIKE